MTPSQPAGGASSLLGDDFDWSEAIGGWRGLVESVAPGGVFVTAYLIWGGFRVPVIAAIATVVAMVAVRLIQRTPVTQALGGLLGVAIGAIWAWRAGDATEFFVPSFFYTGGYAVALLASMLLRWPAVGIVVGLLKGWGGRWRLYPRVARRFQAATAFYLGTQLVKLAVQLPLYFAGATAALGVAKLALGLPWFAVALFVMWRMVRNVELPEEPEDQLQQRE
ncbi:DUF3159 domain-containing protein [Demequina sp. TTPB684]|uniref:DUF3159 domain-containing protein n=1 Tax=unclassified Demequina TaxID=2620311 RepID=UPI001CF41696|nr:DUF3159 domain-containing protein [Demequina sp. TMPB413]MCB2413868.1 DUF3159 domain-containing protein [Demequina sp. TTPB684]UPU89180.1 DUF3159 domain-containing protein [Demequina sp. TMPB413]